MAFTKAGLWGPQAIIDATGHPQPGATATLYLTDEVTLASLWTTSAKSVAMANPTQADIHANLHFYADPGQYRLRVNMGTVVTWLDVEVPIDPGEAAQDQDVVAAQAAAEAYADGIVAAGLATKQPLDSDLTAIAALATTAFGRGLLILADATAGRAAFGSVIGTDVQAHDSDLDAIAALATTAFGRALLVLADAAALRTAAGLGTAATHATGDFDAAGTAAAAVAALVNGAPGALDTLNELATALADDASFATTITNALAAKSPILIPTAVKTGNYTAAIGDYVLCDTSGGIFTVTLPTAPADKTSIAVDLVASGNTLTIARGGADVFQKAGGPTALTMNTANRVLVLQYQSSIAVWHVQDHLPAVITTKGDLLTYGTERARLAVGADGALLGADSTQATGLKWIPSGTYASAASYLGPVFRLDNYLAGGTDARVGLAGAVAAAVASIVATSAPACVYVPEGVWAYASAATKAAIAGSADTGGGAASFGNQGVPLPVNLAAVLNVYFEEGAVLQLGGGARNAFYIDKLADYDTFQHIHFHNANIDNNNVTGRCHVLIGNVPAVSTKQRYLNFSDVHFYGKTKVLNVPVDATQATSAKMAIQFVGDHNTALEATQTSSVDIDVHDIEMSGGDGAVAVFSSVATRVRPGGCNHYYDRIKIRRWRHVNPSTAAAQILQTSVYICGAGFGDRFEIGPGYSSNIGDDAIEIGAMQSGIIDGAHFQDPFLIGVLFRHTHAPSNPATQQIVIRNCKTKITSALSQSQTGYQATPVRWTMDDGVYTLTETGSPAGGTFTLTFVTTAGTITTAAIAFDASAAALATAVQTALAATVTGATCTGTGGPINTTPVVITFGNVDLSSATGGRPVFATTSFTGGSSPAISAVLSTTSPLFGKFVIEDAVFEADGLQYSKQSFITDLFLRGLDQPIREINLVRPRIYLSNYNFDAVSTADLAFIHPASYAGNDGMVWPLTVNITDMSVKLGPGCQLNSGGGAGRLHMVHAEGTHTFTTVDGLETDWVGNTGGGNLAMIGVAKNGGTLVHVNARRLKPITTPVSGSQNIGVRCYTGGGTFKSVTVTQSDFSEVSMSGNEILNSAATSVLRSWGNTYSASSSAVAEVAPSVGSSPWTWSNTTGMTAVVEVSGGTVSAIARGDVNGTFVNSAFTSGTFVVPAGGSLKITYTVAPTVTYEPIP